jgi:hypothetical protein
MQITARTNKPNKYKCELGLRDFYKYYKESVSKYSSKYDLSSNEYKDIIDLYLDKVTTYVIEKGSNYKFYNRLGVLSIRRVKTSMEHLKIDYNHYKETGEKLYILNDHTRGFYFRYVWHRGRISNVNLYSFIPNRTFLKRRLSSYVKNTPLKDLNYL